MRPAKTQISLGICPVWSESSLSAWRKLESLATHWGHSEDSDQTGRMPRLIWVFAGRTVLERPTLEHYGDITNLSRLMTKPTKWHVVPAKTQISLGIRSVWSESLLCTHWVAMVLSFLHEDSGDWSDWADAQPRLIWVFAGRTVILLVLSWGRSFRFLMQEFICCKSLYFRVFFILQFCYWKFIRGNSNLWCIVLSDVNTLYGPRQANLCLWAFRHDKF